MKVSFGTNLYDQDGVVYEECILLFIGENETILKFKDLVDVKDFIREIDTIVIPEILENCTSELCESDLAEFDVEPEEENHE